MGGTWPKAWFLDACLVSWHTPGLLLMHTCLLLAHARFLKIAFVQEASICVCCVCVCVRACVRVCVCMCVSPSLLISSGVVWAHMIG